jgi:CheY-like chemotaxis protein
MNQGQNQPPQGGGGGGRRRRRRHGGSGGKQQQNRGNQPMGGGGGGGGGPQQPGGGGGGRGRRNRRRGGGQPAFVGPMDHSYRQTQGEGNGNSMSAGRPQGRYGNQPNRPQQFFQAPAIDPLPALREDAPTRIFAFIEDLFFVTKIQDTARKLNVKVEFIKSGDELLERLEQQGGEPPALIVLDLNNVNAKPLQTIPKLRAKFKRGTSIVGFVSHVQGDLKLKAQEAGCDVVMPRSAFSQTLPQILRRHGAPEDLEEPQSQFGLGSGPQ